jgi:hypothetical protein
MQPTEHLASAVIHAITVDALGKAQSGKSRDWTQAIWDALKDLATKSSLDLYPKDGPYKGEYLLDFVLWEPDFGPRVIVESQWQHWKLEPLKAFGWAFDKLQGVKADLKVLVFDWDGLNAKQLPSEIVAKLHESMCQYRMNSTSEHYLLIWFSGSQSTVFEWKPIREGKHTKEQVVFSPRRPLDRKARSIEGLPVL